MVIYLSIVLSLVMPFIVGYLFNLKTTSTNYMDNFWANWK